MGINEILITIFTGVVATSAGAYAYLTWRLVSETQRMRRAQTEPIVSVDVELNQDAGHGRMELVIQNVGQGPAKDINIEFEGDPTYFSDTRPIDRLPIIKNGLPYLNQNQSFRILLGWLIGESFTRAIEEPWTFHVQYKDIVGDSKPRKTFVVDFSLFDNLQAGPAPLVKIEKHLEAVQKDVHHLTTGLKKLNVITQTKQEYLEDLKSRRSQREGSAGSEITPRTKEEWKDGMEALGFRDLSEGGTDAKPDTSI